MTLKRTAGPGRPKGSGNKFSGDAKENVVAVFTRLGGTAAMAEWARENPTEFYKIYAKLVPMEHTGVVEVSYVARIPEPIKSTETWVNQHAPTIQ